MGKRKVDNKGETQMTNNYYECPVCNGNGEIAYGIDDVIFCGTCKGKGFLNDAEMTRWKNAIDLQKAWEKHLKEQNKKNAEQGKH